MQKNMIQVGLTLEDSSRHLVSLISDIHEHVHHLYRLVISLLPIIKKAQYLVLAIFCSIVGPHFRAQAF